ncbi:MAG TPA: diguanylate cyclase [Candidatus Saccharibacteria bacterium]|jgi:diguanylate cyclase (GGDEF)-like protein|nr:diguanylate cyclase [Candidatus Saccharibacteria bacterium]
MEPKPTCNQPEATLNDSDSTDAETTKANFLGFLALAKLAGHELNPREMVSTTVEEEYGQEMARENILARLLRLQYAQEALTDLAEYKNNHDNLTGLPELEFWVKEITPKLLSDQSGHILFIDLDGFKALNDALGHEFVDDNFLAPLGLELQLLGTELGGLACRRSGDEFIVYIPDNEDKWDQFKQDIGRIFMKINDSSGADPKMGATIGDTRLIVTEMESTEAGVTILEAINGAIGYADRMVNASKESSKGRRGAPSNGDVHILVLEVSIRVGSLDSQSC